MKKIILLIISIVLTFTNYYKVDNNKSNSKNVNKIIINKINLKQNFFSYEDSNVDNGIIYLKESDFRNDFYILAAHSGNSSISYFKDIYKLKKKDLVYLEVNNEIKTFIVDEIKYIKKNGKIIVSNNLKDVLYLTTCDKFNNKRQLLIKCVKKM